MQVNRSSVDDRMGEGSGREEGKEYTHILFPGVLIRSFFKITN